MSLKSLRMYLLIQSLEELNEIKNKIHFNASILYLRCCQFKGNKKSAARKLVRASLNNLCGLGSFVWFRPKEGLELG